MIFTIHINEKRITGKRNPMIYGHFIEHFHRQIYDGIYDLKILCQMKTAFVQILWKQ